ncbi:hypothetical protein [Emticicia sp. 17c]|uniref:hypothetical protein n=1 Tax=Emticicia sp. 17c TaxID=3127704 RepID=UPI00301D444F
MKSLIIAILCGIIIVSISVSIHHFMNDETAKKSNMSLGVLTSVQGIMSGVVFMVTRFLGKL